MKLFFNKSLQYKYYYVVQLQTVRSFWCWYVW